MDFDIVIVGAGIHGAAVAQAAAAAGYRILLLEQYAQPALGSSSKSSKLIHGGLRYLESGQFGLVRECLRERRRLLHNAPQLVEMKVFHIPVYTDTKRRPWKIRLGLALYALLGGKGFSRVPRSAWTELDGIRRQGLQSVFCYQDAQTDDAALTAAVLQSATRLGAEIEYRCRFESAHCSPGACTVEYLKHGAPCSVQTRALVNAAGPWVNEVLSQVQPRPEKLAIDLVQGTHILIPGALQRGMYYLEAPRDRRAVFVMPWRGNILLGTTETLFTGDPSQVQPTEDEIAYLLEVYNHYFETPVPRPEVIEAFAGLRVLPQSEGAAFHRPRDTLLHIDQDHCPQVLSIYGGKLTSHRATADQVMQRLAPLLPKRVPRADTRTLALPPVERQMPG